MYAFVYRRRPPHKTKGYSILVDLVSAFLNDLLFGIEHYLCSNACIVGFFREEPLSLSLRDFKKSPSDMHTVVVYSRSSVV